MKKNKFYKILTALVAIGVLFTPSVLLAQTGGDLPCSGTDDYANCPLDTWVMVLAFVAFVFAVLHLNRKQRRMPVTK